MAIALAALLAMGPFLHAHYGNSTVTGLHIAGVNTVVITHDALTGISFSQEQEQESAAIGVETSYARQVSMDVEEPPQTFLIFSVFVLAAVACSVIICVWRWHDSRRTRRVFSPGLPVLVHAPPTFRF